MLILSALATAGVLLYQGFLLWFVQKLGRQGDQQLSVKEFSVAFPIDRQEYLRWERLWYHLGTKKHPNRVEGFSPNLSLKAYLSNDLEQIVDAARNQYGQPQDHRVDKS